MFARHSLFMLHGRQESNGFDSEFPWRIHIGPLIVTDMDMLGTIDIQCRLDMLEQITRPLVAIDITGRYAARNHVIQLMRGEQTPQHLGVHVEIRKENGLLGRIFRQKIQDIGIAISSSNLNAQLVFSQFCRQPRIKAALPGNIEPRSQDIGNFILIVIATLARSICNAFFGVKSCLIQTPHVLETGLQFPRSSHRQVAGGRQLDAFRMAVATQQGVPHVHRSKFVHQ